MVILFAAGWANYLGDEGGAGVLDPVRGGAPRRPRAAIRSLTPSTSHEARSKKTGATGPQLFTARTY